MKTIHVINGPNLNMLGTRNPKVYGTKTLTEINLEIAALADKLSAKAVFFQSNHEGELIDYIHGLIGKADGIIINAGAFSHYSYALRDAVEAVGIETVEVHMSQIYRREGFRHSSVIAEVCAGQICGLGERVYILALRYFID